MAKDSAHGTYGRYASGCRCNPCKAANAREARAQRAAARGCVTPPPATVTALPPRLREAAEATMPAQDAEPGRVEAATLAEIGQLSAAAKHQGLVEGALAMARVLDDRRLATTWPSAQRQLSQTLEKLWSASVGRKGKLGEVKAMAVRRGEATG